MYNKFYFFIAILFLPIKIFAAYYTMLDTNIVKEGGIIKAKICSSKLLQAAEVEFNKNSYPVFFVNYDKNNKEFIYSAIIPVPLGFIGKKILIFKIMSDNVKTEKQENIIVKKLKVGKSNISTNKINKEFLEELSAANKAISKLQEKITSAMFTLPFILPVDGIITSDFGVSRSYNKGETQWRHKGIDICAKKGTPVKAANNGIIAGAYYTNIHGNMVIINHGAGIYSFYCHLHKVYVKNNQFVLKNDIIGTVGETGLTTGPHLHWQINIFKIPINPKELL